MRFLNWLDKISWPMLALFALLFAIMPIVPEPHLWQKLKMLADGTLRKPIDIFDLIMHATPAVLLAIKLARRAKASSDAKRVDKE